MSSPADNAHEETRVTLTTRLLDADVRGQIRPYLLVFERDVSTVVHLPVTGETLIGRADDAQVQLRDELVSRAHARVVTIEGEATVVDAGSRHGTRVNGEVLRGMRPLLSGDVIGVGAVTLVFRRDAQPVLVRAFLDPAGLRQRLEEEIARAVRYERTVSVLVLRFGDRAVDRLRVGAALAYTVRLIDVVGFGGPRELVLVLPELDGDDADAVAARVGSALERVAPVRVGVASCPEDGCDADAVIGAARAAAAASQGGPVRVDASARVLEFGEHNVVLADPAMLQVYALIERLARSDLPILIEGETGTGKELAAAAVHYSSPRKAGTLVTINCSALPATLIESELFGHRKGAFTGAVRDKPGLFERASGGSLFLDELGELPADAQAKLLRALESKRITRVGDVEERPVDVRVIAATNRDLQAEIAAGRFREDLYFRLSAARVVLPPLRDRPRELTILARHLLERACERARRRALSISVAAVQALHAHDWPGNVRELKNAMDYAAAMAPDETSEIEQWHLPAAVARADDEPSDEPPASAAPAQAPDEVPEEASDEVSFRPIGDEVAELERTRMLQALEASGWVKNKAAALISMPLRTFVTKCKRYRIERPETE